MPKSLQKSGTRPVHEVCSDCGAPDANWASVNRGVLICNDCASVHMTLGRHVSQVKHMQKNRWHPNLLHMVQHLVSSGANSIWEHSLLDPTQMRSGKRKPNPNDTIHPTKSDFIKSKYLGLTYVHRLPNGEGDISKQLHSSVRTGNLDTCLRLLSQGAHADYFNSEKGNTPLHVAAKCGQSLQVELLVVYGADPSMKDVNGKTAEELARGENHIELADRLAELQYEVTDKFTAFVCGETPDHRAGRHYILPKRREPVLMSQEGRKRLGSLSNQMFEVLAMDIYDEIERRELEKIWQEVQKNVLVPGRPSPALQTEVVPFLPLHPDYSTTRNQGRQKLAHFKDAELNNLICDIISEIIRREQIFDKITPTLPEEDPIYDVPPDDDDEERQQQHHHLPIDSVRIENTVEIVRPIETVPKEKYHLLEETIKEKDTEILKLTEQNRGLITKATDLARENCELKRKIKNMENMISSSQSNKTKNIPNPLRYNRSERRSSFDNPTDSPDSRSSINSTDGSDRRNTIHVTALASPETVTGTSSTPEHVKPDENSSQSSCSSKYDNNPTKEEPTAKSDEKTQSENSETVSNAPNSNGNNNKTTVSSTQPEPVADKQAEVDEQQEATNQRSSSSESPESYIEPEEELTWPESSDLKLKTDLLTKRIQTLFITAQNKKTESYLECAENILSTVLDVVALFDKPHQPTIKSTLQMLCGSAHKLRNRCKECFEQSAKAESHRQLTEECIAYAIEIATAEKNLVMMAPKEEPDAGSAM